MTGNVKTLVTAVRPARAAIFVDSSDPIWESTLLRVIEFYSRLWGGAHNLIIPTDGSSIDPFFWDILEEFDPDYLYAYQRTWADIRHEEPATFQKEVDRHVNNWMAQIPNSSPEDATRHIVDDLQNVVVSKFAISDELQDLLKRRLAPMHFQKWIVNAGRIHADSLGDRHLTAVKDILPNTTHPSRITIIEDPSNLTPPIWRSAVFGGVSTSFVEELERLSIKPNRVSYDENTAGNLVRLALRGQIDTGWNVAFGASSGEDPEIANETPFRWSMLKLGLYRSINYHDWEEPLIVVVGNTLKDFCFYYNISRLRHRTAWMLPTLFEKLQNGEGFEKLTSAEFTFVNEIKMMADFGESAAGLRFLSISHDEEALRAIEKKFAQCCVAGFHRTVTFGGFDKHLISHPLVAYEVDNFHREIIVQTDDDGLMIGKLETPKPKHFYPVHPTDHHWITQLTISGDQPASHFAMGEFIIGTAATSTLEVRVGKSGPAYFCPNTMYFGGDIDTILVRPTIRIPDCMATIRHLAGRSGYECKLSDKGIYTSRTIDSWGGLASLSAFVSDPRGRNLLDKFLLESDSSQEDGVFLNDRRRYLTLRTIQTVYGAESASTLDTLSQRGILHRGFIFQCELCRNSDWFSISEIDDFFVCKRCSTRQRFSRVHWKCPDEPMWFYKLDEIVYQGHRNNMHVSVLALNQLQRRSLRGFLFSPDVEFTKNGFKRPQIEVDFVCIQDGVLTVGECKKDGTLAATAKEEVGVLNDYLALTNALNIRRIVLATFAERWASTTQEAAIRTFAKTPMSVQFLARQDLLV